MNIQLEPAGLMPDPVVPPAPLAALLFRLGCALAALRSVIRRRRARAATRRALRQLDARALKDLALTAGEIDSMASELHGLAAATRRRLEA